MNEITIHIFLDSEGDYQYDIYRGSPEDVATMVDVDINLDGGACTSTMKNAIDMAAEQAKKLVAGCAVCGTTNQEVMPPNSRKCVDCSYQAELDARIG
jgi:hypothetical protein